MAKRQLLTKQLIRQARAPSSGKECWVPDTKVRGFGLRVWTTKNGQTGKSLCVRTRTHEGRQVRLTFDPWAPDSQTFRWFELNSRWQDSHASAIELGDFVEFARDWARKQLEIAKGFRTIEDEENQQKSFIRRRVDSYSLRRAVEIIIAGKIKNGRSQQYCDRLDSIFHEKVPRELQERLVKSISESDIRKIIDHCASSGSSKQVLMHLLRVALNNQQKYGSKPNARISSVSVELGSATESELPSWWGIDQFDQVLDGLLYEKDYWQQALCVFAHLESGIPVSALLKLKWDELYFKSVHAGPDDSESFEQYFIIIEERYRRRGRLPKSAVEMLRLHHAKIAETPYCFPSASLKGSQPISSIEPFWSNWRQKFQLANVSLSKFRKQYIQSGASLRRSFQDIGWI